MGVEVEGVPLIPHSLANPLEPVCFSGVVEAWPAKGWTNSWDLSVSNKTPGPFNVTMVEYDIEIKE
jgi:hypothetical protein